MLPVPLPCLTKIEKSLKLSGPAIVLVVSLSTVGYRLSGPADFVGFSACNSRYTSSLDKCILGHGVLTA